MMKHTVGGCDTPTPPSVTLQVIPNTTHIRRSLRLKRSNDQDAQGPLGKSPSLHQDAKPTPTPTLVIKRIEMAAFFRLFGE
ncbi:hypothetical protein LDENG_00176430 [Lucifuga dentata]|nr:hypothetical protein LDENG_00176430 [Lucifuga dentata]